MTLLTTNVMRVMEIFIPWRVTFMGFYFSIFLPVKTLKFRKQQNFNTRKSWPTAWTKTPLSSSLFVPSLKFYPERVQSNKKSGNQLLCKMSTMTCNTDAVKHCKTLDIICILDLWLMLVTGIYVFSRGRFSNLPSKESYFYTQRRENW